MMRIQNNARACFPQASQPGLEVGDRRDGRVAAGAAAASTRERERTETRGVAHSSSRTPSSSASSQDSSAPRAIVERRGGRGRVATRTISRDDDDEICGRVVVAFLRGAADATTAAHRATTRAEVMTGRRGTGNGARRRTAARLVDAARRGASIASGSRPPRRTIDVLCTSFTREETATRSAPRRRLTVADPRQSCGASVKIRADTRSPSFRFRFSSRRKSLAAKPSERRKSDRRHRPRRIETSAAPARTTRRASTSNAGERPPRLSPDRARSRSAIASDLASRDPTRRRARPARRDCADPRP